MSFIVFRLFNAAAVSLSIIFLALHFGAQEWSAIVYMQTISVFLPFLTFGYNEGFGVFLPLKSHLSPKIGSLISMNAVMGLFLGFVLLIIDIFVDIPNYYYILPLTLWGILNFSLSRIYLRGTGNIALLGRLYIINSLLVLASAGISYAAGDPYLFLLCFSIAQIMSCLFIFSFKRDYIRSIKFTVSNRVITFIGIMSKRGLPLMYAGLLFEVIMNADRLYVVLLNNELNLALLGVALTISKGIFMILSIINTLFYKKMADLILVENRELLTRGILRQVGAGLLSSCLLVIVFTSITSSEIFRTQFPSYDGLSAYIFWQGAFIVFFSIIVPLSTFCNLKLGGGVYFLVILVVSVLMLVLAAVLVQFGFSIWKFYMLSCVFLASLAIYLSYRVRQELLSWQ